MVNFAAPYAHTQMWSVRTSQGPLWSAIQWTLISLPRETNGLEWNDLFMAGLFDLAISGIIILFCSSLGRIPKMAIIRLVHQWSTPPPDGWQGLGQSASLPRSIMYVV